MITPQRIERWFLVLGLLLGIPYALFMGPLQVPDELGHFYRAYTVSHISCMGVPAVGAPVDWREMDRKAVWTELPPHTTAADVMRLIHNPQEAWGLVSYFSVSNLYSCVPYLPSAAAMGVGKWFTPSWLNLMYIGRLGNLVAYLVLTFLALRLVPAFHLPLAGLALMPMALHQGASLSADSISIAFGFLFTACILRLALTEVAVLRWPQYLLIGMGVLLAAMIKGNAGLVFLTLLIPTARFGSLRARAIALSGFVLLAYGAAALWQYANHVNVDIVLAIRAAAGNYLNENASFIFQHPVSFLGAVWRTLDFFKVEYVEEFVGKLGWLSIRLPVWIPWTYVGLLLLAAFAQPTTARISLQQRGILVAVFLINAGTLFAVIWSFEIPAKFLHSEILAGRGVLSGVQGRYLIAFAFLLLVAISSEKLRLAAKYLTPALLVFAVVANLIALNLVWNMYQAHTSTLLNRVELGFDLMFTDSPRIAALRYQGRLVRRPGDSAEDQQIWMIDGGARHWVLNGEYLARHGFKPEDVLFIPPVDLAAIPAGNPITTP